MASTSAAMPEHHADIPVKLSVIDAKGDLWLLVGEEIQDKHNHPTRFHVDSKALSRSSRVFEKLLFGGFGESKARHASTSQEAWVVKLPEDAPIPLEYLLRLMHDNSAGLCVSKVEEVAAIDLGFLYSVLLLADKYDAVATLRPVAPFWLLCLHEIYDKRLCGETIAMAVWVTFHLGDSEQYRQYVACIVNNLSAKGYITYHELLDIDLLPLPVRDTINAEREKALATILEPLRTTMDALAMGIPIGPLDAGHSHVCNSPAEKTACAAHLHGVMVVRFRMLKMWPVPLASEFSLSPEDLNQMVRSVFDRKLERCFPMLCASEKLNSEPGRFEWRATNNLEGYLDNEYTYTIGNSEARFMARQRDELELEPKE
ncbi:hypothetical protein Micbo1qcDRAFT_177117 [Microdochium bolleyi]|uniref:BTB domain-containing protein n=1 Tax=Microdochium bolleyi TaxID=196109 RepID=A0A136IYC6_9PEZI|nr:hypothetical protein Micbo1qcDRAFT_177117 [Microdochium bolleyi]